MKTVYIDSKPYDVISNVRTEDNNYFVYEVILRKNKKLPQLGPQIAISNRRRKVQSTRLSGSSGADNNTTKNKSQSLKSIKDSEYMQAVKDNDEAKLKKMVAEAAKEAGWVAMPIEHYERTCSQ